MKILLADTLSEPGHLVLNSYIYQQLLEFGDVTLAGFQSYLSSRVGKESYYFPESLKNGSSTLQFRLNQMKVLRLLQHWADKGGFDVVIFLTYENISLSLAWHSRIATLVFSHNNLDRLDRFLSERLLYRLVPTSVLHLAFEIRMIHFLEGLGKRAVHCPHPLLFDKLVISSEMVPKPGLIFAPSGGNDPGLLEAFVHEIRKSSTMSLVAKGVREQVEENILVKPRFDDYADLMHSAEYVLLPLCFRYRTSGVFHEAMALGKKIIASRCPLFEDLCIRFPHSIRIVDNPAEIRSLHFSSDLMQGERNEYLAKHGEAMIRESLRNALPQSRN